MTWGAGLPLAGCCYLPKEQYQSPTPEEIKTGSSRCSPPPWHQSKFLQEAFEIRLRPGASLLGAQADVVPNRPTQGITYPRAQQLSKTQHKRPFLRHYCHEAYPN